MYPLVKSEYLLYISIKWHRIFDIRTVLVYQILYNTTLTFISIYINGTQFLQNHLTLAGSQCTLHRHRYIILLNLYLEKFDIVIVWFFYYKRLKLSILIWFHTQMWIIFQKYILIATILVLICKNGYNRYFLHHNKSK